MSAPQAQGGAQALPIARAFLATGGRLMLRPDGKLETAASVERIFGPGTDENEARLSFMVARTFSRRLRNPRFARSVACLVLADGQPTPNGWQVLEAGQ
ncbi:MAG TPA: hypothetical protein VF655_10040 [Allosphingosinicella sp.]|jgi:hypothetical protein